MWCASEDGESTPISTAVQLGHHFAHAVWVSWLQISVKYYVDFWCFFLLEDFWANVECCEVTFRSRYSEDEAAEGEVQHGCVVHWRWFCKRIAASDSGSCQTQVSCNCFSMSQLMLQHDVNWTVCWLRYGIEFDWTVGRACDIAQHSKKFLEW